MNKDYYFPTHLPTQINYFPTHLPTQINRLIWVGRTDEAGVLAMLIGIEIMHSNANQFSRRGVKVDMAEM